MRSEIKQIVEGIIQGEVRVLSAVMTIRQMFSDREKFRDEVIAHVSSNPSINTLTTLFLGLCRVTGSKYWWYAMCMQSHRPLSMSSAVVLEFSSLWTERRMLMPLLGTVPVRSDMASTCVQRYHAQVQKDLNPLGLFIYNANIAEMHDLDEDNKCAPS